MNARQRLLYLAEQGYNIVGTYIPSRRVRRSWLRKAGVKISDTSILFRGCTLQGAGGITIGRGVIVGWRCHLDGRGGLSLHDHVAVASDVHMITAAHDVDSEDFDEVRRAVAVQRHAWLATRCMLLPGVNIGEGAVVAAGAVVSRSVADRQIVAGVPARVVGERGVEPRAHLPTLPILY